MATPLKLISKEELIQEFKRIASLGWIEVPMKRKRNSGSVGNLLEDVLGIPENHLPIPNAAEWELKAQRADTNALLTLCHQEPSPRAAKLVADMLLPYYGWPHAEAGKKYPATEMSFRATLNAASYWDRGFIIHVNRGEERVEVVFDSDHCDKRHQGWLAEVERRIGLGALPTLPYWGFNDLYVKFGSKLNNCFFVQAEAKREGKKQYFHYNNVLMLKNFDKAKLIDAIEQGIVYVDFDARTGHNHGTKFRIYSKNLPLLYEKSERVI